MNYYYIMQDEIFPFSNFAHWFPVIILFLAQAEANPLASYLYQRTTSLSGVTRDYDSQNAGSNNSKYSPSIPTYPRNTGLPTKNNTLLQCFKGNGLEAEVRQKLLKEFTGSEENSNKGVKCGFNHMLLLNKKDYEDAIKENGISNEVNGILSGLNYTKNNLNNSNVFLSKLQTANKLNSTYLINGIDNKTMDSELNNSSNRLAISIGNVIIYNNTYNSLNAEKHLTGSAKYYVNKRLNLLVADNSTLEDNSVKSWGQVNSDSTSSDINEEVDSKTLKKDPLDKIAGGNFFLDNCRDNFNTKEQDEKYSEMVEEAALTLETLVCKMTKSERLHKAVKRLTIATNAIFSLALKNMSILSEKQSDLSEITESTAPPINNNSSFCSFNSIDHNNSDLSQTKLKVRETRNRQNNKDFQQEFILLERQLGQETKEKGTGFSGKKDNWIKPDQKIIEQDLEGLQRLLEALQKNPDTDIKTLVSKIRASHKRSYLYQLWKGHHKLPLAETVDRVREKLKNLAEKALKRAQSRIVHPDHGCPDHWTLLFCLTYAITIWLVVATITEQT